ncbi:MAG TPA: cobaltochelatase subunit CobN [Stellaceae bacterium]|nr:cobaltochelatase subunit CobN [Stellaceae bacterium]
MGSDRSAAFAVLTALAAAGYGIAELPENAAELGAKLDAAEGEAIMLNDYAAFHATLPAAVRDAVAARWGAAERDPHYRPGQVDCGRFIVPVARFGEVAAIATGETTVPPRHDALARTAWIADSFRADAVIAWQPFGVELLMPVLVAPADDPADVNSLIAALDGDGAALHRWRLA